MAAEFTNLSEPLTWFTESGTRITKGSHAYAYYDRKGKWVENQFFESREKLNLAVMSFTRIGRLITWEFETLKPVRIGVITIP